MAKVSGSCLQGMLETPITELSAPLINSTRMVGSGAADGVLKMLKIPMLLAHIFKPNSLNFFSASALPFASSTGLCVCLVTRNFFHSVALDASLTKPA